MINDTDIFLAVKDDTLRINCAPSCQQAAALWRQLGEITEVDFKLSTLSKRVPTRFVLVGVQVLTRMESWTCVEKTNG